MGKLGRKVAIVTGAALMRGIGRASIKAAVPLQRQAIPAEIAAAVVFLASPVATSSQAKRSALTAAR